MVANTKKTSPKIASKAAATLKSPNASATAKSLAASALAQAGTGKQTGAAMCLTSAPMEQFCVIA